MLLSCTFNKTIIRWLKADRHDVFETFRLRHKIAAGCAAAAVANSAIFFKTRCVPTPAYAALNGTFLFLFYSGYINPEVMMRWEGETECCILVPNSVILTDPPKHRPRNHGALYVSANDALNLLKRDETVIVTRVGKDAPKAFPDSMMLRPHTARIGTTENGKQATMTYCGLTNLGMGKYHVSCGVCWIQCIASHSPMFL